MAETIEIAATQRAAEAVRKAGRLHGVRFVEELRPGHPVLIHVTDLDPGRKEASAGLLPAWTSRLRPSLPPIVITAGRTLSLRAAQALALLSSEGRRVAPYLSSPETARRVVQAHAIGAERELIASAEVQGEELVVWSCEPRLYRCAIAAVPALAQSSPRQRRAFTISGSGSRIHWDTSDLDLDLDAIRTLADPSARARAEQQMRAEAQTYGAAIQRLRKQAGLRQADIPGLSEREVRRLEKGETLPHSSSLLKLADAHQSPLDVYMRRLAEEGGGS